MKSQKPTIIKIPLHGLLSILTKLYEEGVDYINIYGGEINENKDVLHIHVNPDYYSKERDVDEQIAKLDNVDQDECIIKHLTDEDLNELL
jgi:hypothetical protein